MTADPTPADTGTWGGVDFNAVKTLVEHQRAIAAAGHPPGGEPA